MSGDQVVQMCARDIAASPDWSETFYTELILRVSSCLQEQLQLTSAQRQQTVRLRNEYLEAMDELMTERAALNVAIQAAAAHTEENAQVAEDHAKVSFTCAWRSNLVS